MFIHVKQERIAVHLIYFQHVVGKKKCLKQCKYIENYQYMQLQLYIYNVLRLILLVFTNDGISISELSKFNYGEFF